MKMVPYKGKIWSKKYKEYEPELLNLLISKDQVVVITYGKPPYNVVLGVPHQAAVGEPTICEGDKGRKIPKDSDENAASYALVTFSFLKEQDIPCKIVIATHPTCKDPNKHQESDYCKELLKDTDLILECHGAGKDRDHDLELSAGKNKITNITDFGNRLAAALPRLCMLAVQENPESKAAIVYNKNGTQSKDTLQNPALQTPSLEWGGEKGIRALHIEAKPNFRKDNSNTVTPDGFILGHALAQVIASEWLKKELEKVEKSYNAKILNMTGAYHREIERQKEYQGRQLLELLQNADDEAEDIEKPGILIRLEQNRLIVANHGLPFTTQGFESLMYSDNSPKIKRLKKIGYKGLGFRAILNWSDSILVKSGAFSLEFSRGNSIEFLNKLVEKNPSLKDEIDKTGSGKHPIATLAAPKWRPTDTSFIAGYDTYVVINFSSEEVRRDIQDQINELRLEVALFLNNLKTIKLESPGRNETILRLPPEKDDYEQVQLIDENGQVKDSKSWRIFKKADELPGKLKTENMKQTEYELRIAVSREMDDKINRLFSYFQTEVKFPFPAIIHGTFDLEGDRKHINVNEVNRFLLEQLADLMTETAKNITQSEGKIGWDAVKLLAKKGEFDDSIEKMDFYSNLIASIKTKPLIPVLSQKYMSAEEKPAFYSFSIASLLKAFTSDFPELALHTSDPEVQALLYELGVTQYNPEELIKRLNKISPNLTIDKRAELIILLVDNFDRCLRSIPSDKMPRLFIDEQGQVVGANTKALLPPEGTTFQLPETVRLVFISSDLARHLRSKAGVKRNRALAEKLTRFNVMEYSAAAVISRVVANTNRAIRRTPSKETELIQKMVQALFTIFTDKTTTDLKFPEKTTVRLFTTKRVLRNASELYFGKEYSIGKIMDALYSPIDDTVFITDKQHLGLEQQPEDQVIAFLKWTGVEQFPRITSQKELKGGNYDKAYEEHVLKNLLKKPYYTNHGELYRSYDELRKHLGSYSYMKVADIENLPIILEKARFEHILAWLHHDPRIQGFFRDDHEPPESSFDIDLSRSGARVHRKVSSSDMSSYLVYKLTTTAWIKTKSGKTTLPAQCCLLETLDGMLLLIELPFIDFKDPVFKENRVDRRAAEHVLTQVGVSEDLSTLPTETVYAILSKLETADPQGSKAKSIYTGIIRSKPKDWDSTLKENEAYQAFLKDGKILAQGNAQAAYVPVTKAYYVDNITFCKEIMNKFPIAEIPRRSGKERIKDIFGVSPLEDIGFTLASEPELHPIDPQFSQHFEAFKPYVLVFRHGTSKFPTELNSLKRFKIFLCNKIEAKYSFDNQQGELTLNPYEHIQPSGENSAYIFLPKDYKDMAELKKDVRFCDAIAEIISGVLKVDENRKDYRELFPKDREERNTIIQSDLDDPTLDKLNNVRRKFRDVSDLQKDFWQSILITKDIDKDIPELHSDETILTLVSKELDADQATLKEVFGGLDYEDLSNLKNLTLIKSLFTAIGISVKDYNLHAFQNIDFNEGFKNAVTTEKFKLQRKFQTFVYESLKDKNTTAKETFIAILTAYETASFIEHYNVNENFDANKQKSFDAAFQQEPFKNFKINYATVTNQEERPLEEIYSKNKEDFQQKLKDSGGAYQEDIVAFLEDAQNKSLLYFGELDELVKRFYAKYSKPSEEEAESQEDEIIKKKKTIQLNGKNEEYEDDNYESLLKNIKDDMEINKYMISEHEPTRPAEEHARAYAGRSGGSHGIPKQKYSTETGFVGEAYVYETFVKKYGPDKVFWVSENAKRANVNPQGSESYGYDMHYIDENDETNYVEVKSSTLDESSFPISPEEVRFGEKHRKDYEVIRVFNALDKKREMKSLGNIFDYEEDESFNNNKKFAVENEGYRIRFK